MAKAPKSWAHLVEVAKAKRVTIGKSLQGLATVKPLEGNWQFSIRNMVLQSTTPEEFAKMVDKYAV